MDEILLREKLFGGEILLKVFDVEKENAKVVLTDAYDEALRLQKIFNLYDSGSEVSIINRDRRGKVSPEFLEVLKNALEMFEKTGGTYDITQGKNFIKRKKGDEVKDLSCSSKDVVIKGDFVELSHKEIVLDFGSLAKGYITDKLAGFLQSKGILRGVIDSRGDIRSFGDKQFEVQIQDPRNEGGVVTSIKISNEGVATSGDYMQYDESFEKSHILNQNQFISVTVVAPTLMKADLFSTVIMVSSERAIKNILGENKDVKVFAIDKDLKTHMFNGFEEVIIENGS